MGATANFDRHDCRTPYSYSFSLLVRSVSCSLAPPVPHGRIAGAPFARREGPAQLALMSYFLPS
jgi:hypothetical protein